MSVDFISDKDVILSASPLHDCLLWSVCWAVFAGDPVSVACNNIYSFVFYTRPPYTVAFQALNGNA